MLKNTKRWTNSIFLSFYKVGGEKFLGGGGADQKPNPKQIIKFVHFVGSDLEQKLFNTP